MHHVQGLYFAHDIRVMARSRRDTKCACKSIKAYLENRNQRLKQESDTYLTVIWTQEDSILRRPTSGEGGRQFRKILAKTCLKNTSRSRFDKTFRDSGLNSISGPGFRRHSGTQDFPGLKTFRDSRLSGTQDFPGLRLYGTGSIGSARIAPAKESLVS